MLINENQFADELFKFYKQQRGGSATPYPVFRGAPYQWGGAGIGDILKALARAGVPIAGSIVGDYIKAATTSFGEGKSIGESLAGAFKPAFGIGVDKTLSALKKTQAAEATPQAGTGRKRKTRAAPSRVYKRAKLPRISASLIPTNF